MLRSPRPEAEIRKLEGAVLDLAGALPAELDPLTSQGFAVLQARRAMSIHRGLLVLADGPSLPSLFVLARPLVEIGISTAWVLIDPSQRIPRWSAEQARRDVQLIEEMRNLGRTAVDWFADEVKRAEAERREQINLVRTRLSLGKREPLVPGLLDMAKEVGTGEAIESYQMGYRSLSPWTHSSEGAFRSNFPEGSYVPDGPPSTSVPLAQLARLMAISEMAWILEQAGHALGDSELARAARILIDISLAAGASRDESS